MTSTTEYSRDVRVAEGSAQRLEKAARSGRAVRIRRGAYVDSAVWAEEGERDHHLRRILAYLRAARGRVVFADESAAVVLGIPLLTGLPSRPVIVSGPAGTSSDGGAIRRARALRDEEVVRVRGISITSPMRTAIDIASTRGPDAGAVAIDDVMRRWGATAELLGDELLLRRPFRGVRSVDAALATASALCESPLESISLRRFARLGFARPDQQVPIRVDGRIFRADFAWQGAAIIGEADGRVKYADPQALWDEKVREDAMRSVSRSFVRIYWSDCADLDRLQAKLHRAGVPRAQ